MIFWIRRIAVIIGLIAGAFGVWFLASHYPKSTAHQDQRGDVVVVAAPTLPAVVQPVESPTPALPQGTCTTQTEYTNYRQELGKLVNDHVLRQYQRAKFAKKINQWRLKHGLPLTFGVNAKLAESKKIVFNNCNPTCAGQTHQVFASQVDSAGYVLVLTKSGKLTKMQIHKSGLEVLTLNEINKKGLPFKSWKLPMDLGPWMISKDSIYKNLDIEGLLLQIPAHGSWKVVPTTEKTIPEKLIEVDPVTVPGCVPEDLCLTNSKKTRFFRMPPVCKKQNE